MTPYSAAHWSGQEDESAAVTMCYLQKGAHRPCIEKKSVQSFVNVNFCAVQGTRFCSFKTALLLPAYLRFQFGGAAVECLHQNQALLVVLLSNILLIVV